MNDSTLDDRPRRVQVKHLPGIGSWTRLPPGTIYVGRPTRWGNPYKLTEYSREEALSRYTDWLQDMISVDPTFLDPLVGKNLACWCKLTEKCHADILLRVLYHAK